MLKTFIATEEPYDAFLRPAIYDSIKAVLQFYKLESAANIYYNGDNEIAKLVGNNRTDSPDAQRYTDGTFRDKIFIVPEISRSDFWNNRRERVERPIFLDKSNLPLILTPSFENKLIRVKVVCMHTSRATAFDMKNRINRARENQVVDFNFSPTTHMVINPQIIQCFRAIHELLVKNDPNTPALDEWFFGQCWNPVHEISNVKGNHKRLAVPIKFANIGIQFSEPFISQVNKGQTYGRYEVEFNYSFYLNDFTGWELEYPLNVYQDEIPAQYIPAPQESFEAMPNTPAAPEIADIRAITAPSGRAKTPFYLKLPAHDPWAWPKLDWVEPIIQARLALQDLPEQSLGNIFDIPGFGWKQNVVDYIKRRHAVAFSHHETPFLFQVFSNDIPVDPQYLSMDADGLITLHKGVVMRNTYRVVVTLDWAIRDYSDAFWYDLFKNQEGWKIMQQIFTWYAWDKLPKPWDHNVYQLTLDIAKGYGQPRKPMNIYEMNLDLIAYNAANASKR